MWADKLLEQYYASDDCKAWMALSDEEKAESNWQRMRYDAAAMDEFERECALGYWRCV